MTQPENHKRLRKREAGGGRRLLASFWLLQRPTIRVYPLSSVGCFPKAELLQRGKDLVAQIIEQVFGFVKKNAEGGRRDVECGRGGSKPQIVLRERPEGRD